MRAVDRLAAAADTPAKTARTRRRSFPQTEHLDDHYSPFRRRRTTAGHPSGFAALAALHPT